MAGGPEAIPAEIARRVAEITETQAALLDQYRSLARWVLGLNAEWPTASHDFLNAFASIILERLAPRLVRVFKETENELLALGTTTQGGREPHP